MHPHSDELKGDSESSEWTVVPRGKRQTHKTPPKAPGSDRSLNLDRLLANYHQRTATWRSSTCRQEIRKILDQKQPEGGWQIKKAICFASGSFCRDNFELQKRSMIQFVAFMDTVDHLQSTSDEKIEVVARELVYTPMDVEFLSNLHVNAATTTNHGTPKEELQDADEFEENNVFVFEPFMDKPLAAVKELMAPNATLFIGTGLTISPAHVTTVRELNDRRLLYKTFEAEYDFYRFPYFEEDRNVFEGLRICWKKESEND